MRSERRQYCAQTDLQPLTLLSDVMQPVRTVRGALVLPQLGEGESSPRIAASVGVVVAEPKQSRRIWNMQDYDRRLPEMVLRNLLKSRQILILARNTLTVANS